MIIKKNIVLYITLVANLFFLLSVFFKNITLGSFWYNIHSNSLIGFQNYAERNLNFFYFNINIYDFFLKIFNFNFFFLNGFCFILIAFIVFNRSRRP